MNQHPSNNSEARAEQAASVKQYQSIKLGLDVHADSIVVVRILDHSGPQPAQRFHPKKFLEWVTKQLEQAQEVHSCYEAGPFGYVLHRQLMALGIRNVVIQPVRLNERHTRVDNDKTDARELAIRLDRLVSGNPRALAIVRVPTPEEEQKRIHSRQRQQVRQELGRVAAQGRSLLLSQGYREKKQWWSPPRWTVLKVTVPQWLADRLEVFRQLLEALQTQLDTLTASLVAAAPSVRPKGMGGLSLETIEREVGDWGRFNNRRQVGSITGLCGGVSDSGLTRQQLPITKHGNVRMRTALVELAWRMLIWQSDCKAVKRWRPILSNPRATRAARKKAVIAIARQTAVDLWRWRTGRATPENLGWTMNEA